MNGIAIKNRNVKSVRVEKTGTITGDMSVEFSFNNLTANTPVTVSNVIAIIPEGVRPTTSWGQVHPVTYYNSGNEKWGFYNYGTGGDYIANFILLYDAELT